MRTSLPVDDWLDEIEHLLESTRALVVIADPGAGKSTRVAPHLSQKGKTILLQPRRVAARNVAQRIADENNWTIGKEVGWHVRLDRRESRETRLLVATEGILTSRLQSDPLASEFTTIILDEFHERSSHSDLAIALAREASRAREDLRIVVMSATLDPEPVARFLGGASVIRVPGRSFDVDVRYEMDATLTSALQKHHGEASGHTLVFLPGKGEIAEAMDAITSDRMLRNESILPLHGSMPADEQQRAIAPSQRRRIILSTNVAETSVTIEGVDLVIDTGLHKVMRFDAERGIDRLVTERIPLDSAAQRSGRAGRTRTGTAVRLWDPRLILRERREPEIHRIDLAASALAVFAWGADPATFSWFEPPEPSRLAQAIALLERLELVRDGRITDTGRTANRIPAHPRIGRFLQMAGGDPRSPLIAAALVEGLRLMNSSLASDSDLLALADQAVRNKAVAAIARDLSSWVKPARDVLPDERLLRAALSAWPDRVARRRGEGSEKYQLATGGGAILARESSVRNADWLVALELGSTSSGGDALLRMASRIDPSWLVPTERRTLVEETGSGPVAWEQILYDAIVLRRSKLAVDDEALRSWRSSQLMRSEDPGVVQLRRRLAFAELDVDLAALAGEVGSIDAATLARSLPYAVRKQLDAMAPAKLRVPSGREHRLSYREDGGVELEVKLQELFGLIDSPRLGPAQTPVTIVMLSPGGRPVQTTADLRSFWENTYFEVRRELRGRYPKHPWPEDPLSAQPTHRAKRRGGGG